MLIALSLLGYFVIGFVLLTVGMIFFKDFVGDLDRGYPDYETMVFCILFWPFSLFVMAIALVDIYVLNVPRKLVRAWYKWVSKKRAQVELWESRRK